MCVSMMAAELVCCSGEAQQHPRKTGTEQEGARDRKGEVSEGTMEGPPLMMVGRSLSDRSSVAFAVLRPYHTTPDEICSTKPLFSSLATVRDLGMAMTFRTTEAY